MKKIYPSLLSLLLIAFIGTESQATEEQKTSDTKNPQIEWSGVWKDENGTLISVREVNRFLDIVGNDSGSAFSVTCIVEKNNNAKCVGQGTNHVQGLRYIYQSTLMLETDNKLTENWEAITVQGNLQGKSSYFKVGEIQTIGN